MSKTRPRKPQSVIESSRVPLRLRKTALRFAPRRRAAQAPEGHWQHLDFPLQHQQHTNWCWAAVTTSVALYYEPHGRWTQCGVANRQLGRKDCCARGAHRSCNVIGHLDKVLRVVRRLARRHRAKSTFTQTGREIHAGRPLGVRIEWVGGGGHFVTIVGYLPEQDMLAIDDPFHGRSHVDYRTFCRSYHGAGTWTDSYYTKR
jgi:hypothetical protein